MWLTSPCGQNSDWREALFVDFPPRLDFIICSNRQLFCFWNEPEEAEVLAEGAAGRRPSRTGLLCLGGIRCTRHMRMEEPKGPLLMRAAFGFPFH